MSVDDDQKNSWIIRRLYCLCMCICDSPVPLVTSPDSCFSLWANLTCPLSAPASQDDSNFSPGHAIESSFLWIMCHCCWGFPIPPSVGLLSLLPHCFFFYVDTHSCICRGLWILTTLFWLLVFEPLPLTFAILNICFFKIFSKSPEGFFLVF